MKLPFWGRLPTLRFVQVISLDAGRASINTSDLVERKFKESREVAPQVQLEKGWDEIGFQTSVYTTCREGQRGGGQ